jgi:hypothetical protein
MAIGDEEKAQIRAETRRLIEEFSKALANVKGEEANVIRPSYSRKEGEGKKPDSSFKEIMLENAPNKTDEAIVAEKKSW